MGVASQRCGLGYASARRVRVVVAGLAERDEVLGLVVVGAAFVVHGDGGLAADAASAVVGADDLAAEARPAWGVGAAGESLLAALVEMLLAVGLVGLRHVGAARGDARFWGHKRIVNLATSPLDKPLRLADTRGVSKTTTQSGESRRKEATMAPTHSTTITPKAATGNGDLDGHKVFCTCGLVFGTSLGEREARNQAAQHLAWHAKVGR